MADPGSEPCPNIWIRRDPVRCRLPVPQGLHGEIQGIECGGISPALLRQGTRYMYPFAAGICVRVSAGEDGGCNLGCGPRGPLSGGSHAVRGSLTAVADVIKGKY